MAIDERLRFERREGEWIANGFSWQRPQLCGPDPHVNAMRGRWAIFLRVWRFRFTVSVWVDNPQLLHLVVQTAARVVIDRRIPALGVARTGEGV